MSQPLRKSSRQSTIKQSRELEICLSQRELKAQERKSKKLGKLNEQEFGEHSEEVYEFIDLADEVENSAIATENLDNLATETNVVLETEIIADPLGVLTPRVVSNRIRSVSTELNRLECGNTSSLTPGRSCLAQSQPIIGVSPLQELNEIEDNYEVFEIKMDDNVYRANLKQAKLHKRQFNSFLSLFTADEVIDILHKETYKEKLNSIGIKFLEISDWFDSLIIDLEENNENERITEIESIQTEMKNIKKNHEKLIMSKLSELISAQPADGHTPALPVAPALIPADPGTIARNENKKLEELRAKARIKKSFTEDRIKSLKQKVQSFKTPSEMTNDEVRFAMKESKSWEKKYDEIVTEQQRYYEECVPFDDMEEDKENVILVEALGDAISDKVSLLEVEDEERGLSCRAENKSKDTVVFPSQFKGDLGKNVFKFVDEIKNAIIDSQIKKSDQVKTLLKYLGGEAKKRCGDHYPDLESALTALKEFYGNAALIWMKTRNEFEAAFTNLNKEWGEYGDPARVTAIARVIEFLRQSDSLAKEYPELSPEVYSSSTLSLLRKVLPRDYIEKVNDTISDVSATSQQKMASIKTFLERKKTSALMGVETLKTQKSSRIQSPQETIKPAFRDPLGLKSQATNVTTS